MVNSSCSRFGTRRPWASSTVAGTDTIWVVALKVGVSCLAATVKVAATSITIVVRVRMNSAYLIFGRRVGGAGRVIISRMRTACLAAGLLISLACSSQAQQQGGQEAAARIGDRTVTLRELDDRWKREDPAAKAQADQAVYDGRRAALEAIIADALIGDAAKAKGLTTEKFVQDEVAKRLKPVSDTDVRNFYVQNSERMQGRTFEQMGAAIQQYLEEQHQNDAKQALIADLRKSGPPIRVVMDAPRSKVQIDRKSDGEARGESSERG